MKRKPYGGNRGCTRAVWIASLALGAALIAPAQPARAQGWKPEKPVEIIALNAPGGGADRIIRLMQSIIQERRLTGVPLNVVNKPGGGGAVGYNYLNQHPGDGHYVVLSSKAILTNNIVGQGPSHREFTPVANLFAEYISVTVRPDSPLKSGRDLVERLKKDPAALSFGIATALGNFNHIGLVAGLKEAGVDIRKLRTVVFQSGGAATTAMLGGHIDVVPVSAAFSGSMARNGQVRVLTVTSPRRLGDVLADVPTWTEQGLNVVVSNSRSITGPRGMTEAQVAWWDQALRKLIESDEWKKELERNFWTAEYLNAADTRRLFDEEHVRLRAFLTELGLARQ